MIQNLTFRKGLIEDTPIFLAFFKTSLPTLFPHYSPNIINFTLDVDYNPKFLTERLSRGSKKVYLAFENERVVGYLLVAHSTAGVSSADWLAVDEKFQKRGIASQLLSLWEDETLFDGGHALQLWTTEKNVEFYNKRGFSQGGLFPQAWHGKNAYLFYKTLREPEEKNFLKSYLQQVKKE